MKRFITKPTKGVPQFDLKEIGETDQTGTAIRFKADGDIFTETTVYNYETLQQRIRELAFLNKGIQITLRDEREEEVREDSITMKVVLSLM